MNNYIHDFFVNESLGSKLDLKDEEVQKQYRNSFDWFGFGLESDDAVQEETILENKDMDSTETNSLDDIVPDENNDEKGEKSQKDGEGATSLRLKTVLVDKIKDLLSMKQMKSTKIASELGTSKKEINQILYSNTDLFAKDIFFNWRLKK